MYTVRDPKTYDPAIALLAVAIRDHKKQPLGHTQKDRARAEGNALGVLEGRLDGVAAVLNERRCERYPEFTHLPILTAHDLRNIYAALVARYEDDASKLPKNSKHDERKTVESKMWEWISEALGRITFPENLEEQRIEARRNAILSGEMSPEEEDFPWLNELLQQRQAETDAVAGLLGK